jgi:hypothetical protein
MLASKVLSESKVPMTKELTITEFARMGGKARSKTLTAKRRKEIAAKGARARWGKPKGKSK